MNERKIYILIFFKAILLLQQQYLSAQDYPDLWRNGKTDNFYLIQKKFNEYFANRNNKSDAARENKQEEDKDGEYVQFKRWEEFMAPRVYPSGKLINPAKLALDEELRYEGRAGNTQRRSSHTGNWQSLGINYFNDPFDEGGGMGRVNCIAPHPSDPQTLFIGTPAGGLWKTTDGGANWIPLSDGLPVIGVSGIAINPHHPDSIYILTGDGDGGDTYSIGVLLSPNGGDTWQSTGLQFNVDEAIRGYKLMMHPTHYNILFAITDEGVYKTTNSSISWTLTQPGHFTDLAFKPGDPSTVYAVANLFYISSDTGTTWVSKPLGHSMMRGAIGVTPANPGYIYLLSGYSIFKGLYRSEDGGQSFSIRSDSPNILGWKIKSPFALETQAFYDLAIAVSPTDAEEVHIGGVNCWKSTNGGTTWSYTSYWQPSRVPPGKYVHADIHSLVFNGNTLYCGNDGGIYFSTDHAATWTDISYGLDITQLYSIGAAPDNLDVLYGGAQDNNIFKWTASNSTIMEHQLGGDGLQCVMDYFNNNIAYAFLANVYSELFVTVDGGATDWEKRNIPFSGSSRRIVPLIIHPSDPDKLYAGYSIVTQITDLGYTTAHISPDFGEPCVALAISPANPSYLYAAGERYLELCTDITTSTPAWTTITGALPVNDAQITDVEVSANDVTKAWVSFSGYANGIKMYQTTDAGTTWVNISGSLPNVPVNCIAYENNGTDGIYIGTDIGVFYRNNTMTDWVPFRSGMPNVIVYDLKITNDKIRAATFGRSIWESDLYGNCESLYTLSGDVTGYQFLEASYGINSTTTIKGGMGTNVQYKAADIIKLNTGFKVAPESRFIASLGECDNSTLNRPSGNNRQYRGIYEGPMQGALGIASIADSALLSSPVSRLKVYPNPFSQQSTIEFFLAKPTAASISVWDLSGKKIKTLFESQRQAAGNYQVRLTSEGISNGIYFVRLQTQDYQETKKIVITK